MFQVSLHNPLSHTVSQRALQVHDSNCSQSNPGFLKGISHIPCFVWLKTKRVSVRFQACLEDSLVMQTQSGPTTGLCDGRLVTFSIQKLKLLYTIHLLFMATVKKATSYIIIQDLVTMVMYISMSMGIFPDIRMVKRN